MSSIRHFIKTHPVLCYYILTFLISWGAILPPIIAGGIPPTKAELSAMLPFAIGGMLLGPLVSALVMTALVDGRAGFRELGARLLKWHVGWGWYAFAVLMAPALVLAVLLGLSLFSPVYLPGIITTADKPSVLIMGLISAIFVGICEEVGWTGFVTPRLRLRYSVLTTGLIIGVLHGLWHILPMDIMASGAYAPPLSQGLYITARAVSFLLGPLVAFRILLVWVYDRTGSLPVAIIMHIGLTAANMIFQPETISGAPALINDLVGIMAFWLAVAIVAAAARGQLGRAPALPQPT